MTKKSPGVSSFAAGVVSAAAETSYVATAGFGRVKSFQRGLTVICLRMFLLKLVDTCPQ